MKAVVETHRKCVEDVRRVAETGEQDQRRATSAPIQDFERKTVPDADERTRVRRRVGPLLSRKD